VLAGRSGYLIFAFATLTGSDLMRVNYPQKPLGLYDLLALALQLLLVSQALLRPTWTRRWIEEQNAA